MSKCIARSCCPSVPSDGSGVRCAGVGGVVAGFCSVRRGSCVCGGCSVCVCAAGVFGGGVLCVRCCGGFDCCPNEENEARTNKAVRARCIYCTSHEMRQFFET